MTCRMRSIADHQHDPPAVGRGKRWKARAATGPTGRPVPPRAQQRVNTTPLEQNPAVPAMRWMRPCAVSRWQHGATRSLGRFCPLRPRNPLNIGRASRRTPEVEAIRCPGSGGSYFWGRLRRRWRALPACGRRRSLPTRRTRARIFASTCSACHKSPQGLAKSGQVAGFLRQHYTTGPEMSAAMAAYLVAAGSAPAAKKGQAEAKAGQSADHAAKAQIQKAGGRRPVAGRPPRTRKDQRTLRGKQLEQAKSQDDRMTAHPSPASAADAAAREAAATAASPAVAEHPRGAGAGGGSRTSPPLVTLDIPCRSCRPRRRPISLSRFSLPRPCPDRRLLLRASRRTPRPRPLPARASVSSRRCVTFSPRA